MHTREPWKVLKITSKRYCIDSLRPETRLADIADGIEQKPNADRIVACVNACAGLNPEAVPVMYKALKAVADIITNPLKGYDDNTAEICELIEAVDTALTLAEKTNG